MVKANILAVDDLKKFWLTLIGPVAQMKARDAWCRV